MFSQNLKNLRRSHNLTQKEMASMLNLNIRQYQRYESSEVDPPLSKVIAIANYFKVSLDDFVGMPNSNKE